MTCMHGDKQGSMVYRRNYILRRAATVGLLRTVVSILHCGCSDPGSIPGEDKTFSFLRVDLLHTWKVDGG